MFHLHWKKQVFSSFKKPLADNPRLLTTTLFRLQKINDQHNCSNPLRLTDAFELHENVPSENIPEFFQQENETEIRNWTAEDSLLKNANCIKCYLSTSNAPQPSRYKHLTVFVDTFGKEYTS